MGIRLEMSCEQLSRVEKLLYGIPNGASTAISNAFNSGLNAAKTEARKQIQQRYAISWAQLSREKFMKVKIQKSYKAGTASIEFSGQKIPLYKYSTYPKNRTYVGEQIPVVVDRFTLSNEKWRMVFKNSHVKAMDTKAKGWQHDADWFIATFSNDHTGIFSRVGIMTSGKKERIKEAFGYSVADMLDYEPAKEAVAKRVQEVVERRLEHEIGRILSRY